MQFVACRGHAGGSIQTEDAPGFHLSDEGEDIARTLYPYPGDNAVDAGQGLALAQDTARYLKIGLHRVNEPHHMTSSLGRQNEAVGRDESGVSGDDPDAQGAHLTGSWCGSPLAHRPIKMGKNRAGDKDRRIGANDYTKKQYNRKPLAHSAAKENQRQ